VNNDGIINWIILVSRPKTINWLFHVFTSNSSLFERGWAERTIKP